ncbi:hypothetical protein ACFSTC_34825 [Nonomuraea ferruginea]
MERDGVERLLGAAGVDSRRLRHALTLLCDGRWWSLADLVRETATSRRTIEELLRELRTEREGDRFRLPPDALAGLPGPAGARAASGGPGPAPGRALRARAGAAARAGGQGAAAPPRARPRAGPRPRRSCAGRCCSGPVSGSRAGDCCVSATTT